jgi:hypothetical protein
MANKFKIRSSLHLKWVASFPCTITRGGLNCNIEPVHPDHLMRTGDHSMGSKACDANVLPLCWHHHHEKTITGDERHFWQKYGLSWAEVLKIVKWYKENSPCPKIRNK